MSARRLNFSMVLLWAVVILPDVRAELLVEPTAEAARGAVLTWAKSLQSFEGSYVLSQHAPQDPQEGRITFNIFYRFDGENRYMSTETVTSQRTATHVDALLNGRLENMELQDSSSGQGPSGIRGLGVAHWLFPPGSLIAPEMLFGRMRGQDGPLDAFMSEGESALFMREGQQVLRHRRDGEILDIWLGEQDFQVRRFEVSYTDYSPAEVKAHWSGDEFEIRNLVDTLELTNYMDIDGVQFPSRAVLTVWEPDAEALAALRVARDREGIQPIDWFIQLCTELPRHPAMIQEFDLDLTSTHLNAELPASAFQIVYPTGTVLFDENGVRLDNARPWWKPDLSLGVLLSDYRFWLVLVVVLAIASAGLRIVRTRIR